jgi:hypothetical protein
VKIMSSRCSLGRRSVLLTVMVCGTSFGTSLNAQPASAANAAADSIKCWWKTDKDAVLVGEQFALTLTCGVVENSRTKIAADAKQFEPTALSLAPFEVLDGTAHADIQDPPWRYFQREYRMRLLGETFFGQDVDIPELKVTYGMRSAATGEAEGRDQTIVLPALPMRVHSLVAKSAKNIRDGSTETFGDIETRLSQATNTLTAAGVFFAFAVVLLGLSVRKMVSRYMERAPTKKHPMPAAAVLRGCFQELGLLKADVAREGWTEQMVGRALTLFRIAGAVALGRRVAQTMVDRAAEGRTGQLKVRKGILSRKRALVSAPITADAIARQLADGAAPEPRTRLALGEIRESLLVFNAAHYRRNGQLDVTALDAALAHGEAALRRMRFTTRWRVRTADALVKSVGGRGAAV